MKTGQKNAYQVSATQLHQFVGGRLRDASWGNRVVVTRNGREWAAIVSMRDFRLLQGLDKHYREALGALAAQNERNEKKLRRFITKHSA
jgi:prevent-host-death family protein